MHCTPFDVNSVDRKLVDEMKFQTFVTNRQPTRFHLTTLLTPTSHPLINQPLFYHIFTNKPPTLFLLPFDLRLPFSHIYQSTSTRSAAQIKTLHSKVVILIAMATAEIKSLPSELHVENITFPATVNAPGSENLFFLGGAGQHEFCFFSWLNHRVSLFFFSIYKKKNLI